MLSRCVIAPSFADIFYNNCFKNGILPISLNQEIIDELTKAAESNQNFTIDLPNCYVKLENGKIFEFELDSFRKECLINGLDDIGLTLKKKQKIDQFELENQKRLPWLYQEENL